MSGSKWDVFKEASLGIGLGSYATMGRDDNNLRTAASGSRQNEQLLVQFERGIDVAVQAAALDSVGGRLIEVVRQENVHDGSGPLALIEIGADSSAETAVAVLTHLPGVAFAEPNGQVSIDLSKNDPGHPGNGVLGTHDDSPATNTHGSQAGEAGSDLAPLTHPALTTSVNPAVEAAPPGNADSSHSGVIAICQAIVADGGTYYSGAGSDVHPTAVSNDPKYTDGDLWGMYGDTTLKTNAFGSQAGEAWAAGYTGSTKSIVGVIDTGIDYTHPDLYLNIWLNQGEIPVALRDVLTDMDNDGLITFRDLNNSWNASYVSDNNHNTYIDAGDLLYDVRWADGCDEEGNCYIDDLIGWDFVNNDKDPNDDSGSYMGHGTHVSGIIGAMGGNGVGVAGVNWNVQMAALRYWDNDSSDIIAAEATDYFTNAARRATTAENFVATNNSRGGFGDSSQVVKEAIVRGAQQDILFIASAGNANSNNDTTPYQPVNVSTTAAAGYEAVIAVASLESSGERSGFSNYGVTTVDLAAPGGRIISTFPGGGYTPLSGTSLAAPYVTGAAALYAAAHPTASAAEIRSALLASVAPTASFQGKTVTGGRLDIGTLMGGGIAPTATITLADTTLKRGETSLVIFAFSEQVVGFDNSDVICENGTLSTLTSNDGGRVWTGIFTPATNLEDATNVIRLAATYADLAGNSGNAATSANYAINTKVLGAPRINIVAGDNVINAAEQGSTITGTAEANVTVALTLGGSNVRAVTADSSGRWSYTLVRADIDAMGQGPETIRAVATDAAGKVIGEAGRQYIGVDTVVPAAPTINPVAGDDIVDVVERDSPLTLTGTCEAGAAVVLGIGGTTRTATVNGSTWSCPLTADDIGNMAGRGAITLSVTQTDAADNVSTAGTRAITIPADTTSVNLSAIAAGTGGFCYQRPGGVRR